jgi:hypothetical protein
VLPTPKQEKFEESKVLVHITAPKQSSVVVIPPLDNNQFENSKVLPNPSHNTDTLFGGERVGASLSIIENVAVVLKD